MRYVSYMDAIWKMSERRYKAMVREVEKTGMVENLDSYGKMIVADAESLEDIINSIEESGGVWSENLRD